MEVFLREWARIRQW